MKIALTYTGSEEKHNYYVQWLQAGESIDIVKLSAEEDNVEALLGCDALVLSGGVDIYPNIYDSHNYHYKARPAAFNEKRDDFEIAAYVLAKENNLPVLGICRGLQLINVIQGGTLIQNLQGENINHTHAGNPDKTHSAGIVQNTLLGQILGNDNVVVNSAHHQAIDKLGSGLIVNAKSEDGIVEGIEWMHKTGSAFMLAVQWHPERMFQFNLENTPASKAIRDRFIDEIRKTI